MHGIGDQLNDGNDHWIGAVHMVGPVIGAKAGDGAGNNPGHGVDMGLSIGQGKDMGM